VGIKVPKILFPFRRLVFLIAFLYISSQLIISFLRSLNIIPGRGRNCNARGVRIEKAGMRILGESCASKDLGNFPFDIVVVFVGGVSAFG
jgi:hypothetical protein